MAAKDFLNKHLRECREIIDSLLEKKDSFTSHEFIEKFRAKFPKEYISWLGAAPEAKDAQFQTVNSLLARFLRENETVFKIDGSERGADINDHGNKTGVQIWKRK